MAVALETPNAKKVYYVTWEELPLSCPTPAMSLWNSHQRVYLPIQESGREQCPYCGSVYILVDPDPDAAPAKLNNVEIERFYHQQRTILRKRRVPDTPAAPSH